MSTAVFDSTLVPRFGSIRIPMFEDVIIVGYGGKNEQRISLSDETRYKFDLSFPPMEADAVNAILGFFIARKGKLEGFYYPDQGEAYQGEAWSTGRQFSTGMVVRPTVANGHSYRCITAGSATGAEPSWSTTINATVADGAVSWQENSYYVRFDISMMNFEMFESMLTDVGRITLVEVST